MSKPGADPASGISLGDVLRLPKRHPACRRREAQSGSCTERENLAGDAKGKGTSGSNREAESTDAPERGGLPRSSNEGSVMGLERRGWVIAVGLGPTGSPGGALLFNGRRQPSRDGTSRMMREYQVRICEGLGVQFPGPTRQNSPWHDVRDKSAHPLRAAREQTFRHFLFVPIGDIGSAIQSPCRRGSGTIPELRGRLRWRS
jgi:hypothetical protein